MTANWRTLLAMRLQVVVRELTDEGELEEDCLDGSLDDDDPEQTLCSQAATTRASRRLMALSCMSSGICSPINAPAAAT